MNHLLLVDILETQQQLDQPLNNLFLAERLILLFSFFEVLVKVSSLSMLHDNADAFIFHKGLDILHNVVVV